MRSLRLSMTALLLLLAGPAALSAQEPNTPEIRYEVRFLDAHAAEALAWDLCPDKNLCQVQGLRNATNRGTLLTVRATPETHARLARALSERDLPRTQSFQVVLLAAGGKPDGGTPDLAPGARKALDDLKQFLPYKTYRTLDTAWIRINQDDVAQARMAGLLGATYSLVIRFRAGGPEGKQLFVEGFGLAEGKDRNLIQTTFAMDVGETVVVGTSSVSGSQEALVALLTAVP